MVDLEIPSQKGKILEVAEGEVDRIQEQYNYGLIMEDEREQKIVNAWTKAADDVVDAILKNLKTFFADKTVILISQRVSSLQNSDLIFVLKDGRIIEKGLPSNIKKHLFESPIS